MANLTLYKASAGSGKTYSLALEYLRHLIRDPGTYRRILAVTFTNKATGEMKHRIVHELNRLAAGEETSYLTLLVHDLRLTPGQVREQAQKALKLLLHDFSRFSVETIDTFFQRVMRSFIREMGLQSGFNLELDTDKILSESVDNMLFTLGTNPSLKEWLVRFAESRIGEGKPWNFKSDILSTGQEIFRERFKLFSRQITGKLEDREFMKGYLEKLYRIRNYFLETMKEMGLEGLALMERHTLEPADFAHKNSSFASYFVRLSEKRDFDPGPRVRKALNDLSAWSAKGSDKERAIREIYHAGLNSILVRAVEFHDTHSEDYVTAEAILDIYYTLGILTDLSKQVSDYCFENNLFLISEVAGLLKEIIEGNEAPFIYEKIGNIFQHYMMDEFQDTSWIQWENFRPLLLNSLAENNDCLLVGDVKQSIYRWRNGDWKILSEQLYRDFNPPSLQEVSLNMNWRSKENIVRFNNAVFSRASTLLRNQFREIAEADPRQDQGMTELAGKITQVYRDVIQEIPGGEDRKGGMVRIRFFSKEEKDWKEQVKDNLPGLIDDLLGEGYRPGDIALLVRNARDGREIVTSLLSRGQEGSRKNDYDIISNEALFLTSSSAVQFVVSVMRFLLAPDDRINAVFMLSEYTRFLKPGTGGGAEILEEICSSQASHHTLINNYMPEEFSGSLRWLPYLPLFDLTERIVRIFALNSIRAEIPYIQAFQDTIIEYCRNEPPDIHYFLEWWAGEGAKKTLALSEQQNAVRVITIHKAKGLEFPVVIIPFCNWHLDHMPFHTNIIWCTPGRAPFNDLDLVPVKYSGNLARTIFTDDYYTEKLHAYVDNINLLYVAFTRAIRKLVVFTQCGGKQSMTHVGDLLNATICSLTDPPPGETMEPAPEGFIRAWKPDTGEFAFGKYTGGCETKAGEDKHRLELTGYEIGNIGKRLRLSLHKSDYLIMEEGGRKARINRGNLMHEVFEYITTRKDIDTAARRLVTQGKITPGEAESLRKEVTAALDKPIVENWFDGGWEVKTEADILLKNKKIRRPDRIMIAGERAIVVDYKFGVAVEASHKTQIRRYIKYLEEMGYKTVSGYIWYVDLDRKIRITS